jgi:hypothetical protein
MDAHPFSDPGLFDVLGDNRLDGGDVQRRAVLGQEQDVIVQDEFGCAEAKVVSEGIDLLVDKRDLAIRRARSARCRRQKPSQGRGECATPDNWYI